MALDFGAWNADLAGFRADLALGRANSSATSTAGHRSRLGSVGPFKGSLRLAYGTPSRRFGASLTGTHTEGRRAPADIMQGSTTTVYFAVPSATLLDFTIHYRFSGHLSLNAGVYNLTDEKYWDYYNARGLTATAASEIERYVQPGANGFISLNLSY